MIDVQTGQVSFDDLSILPHQPMGEFGFGKVGGFEKSFSEIFGSSPIPSFLVHKLVSDTVTFSLEIFPDDRDQVAGVRFWRLESGDHQEHLAILERRLGSIRDFPWGNVSMEEFPGKPGHWQPKHWIAVSYSDSAPVPIVAERPPSQLARSSKPEGLPCETARRPSGSQPKEGINA